MKYSRITVHFDTVKNAKKVHRILRKRQNQGYYSNIETRGKKVSIENDSEGCKLTKHQIHTALQESRNHILLWLDGCKGLSYTVLVSR